MTRHGFQVRNLRGSQALGQTTQIAGVNLATNKCMLRSDLSSLPAQGIERDIWMVHQTAQEWPTRIIVHNQVRIEELDFTCVCVPSECSLEAKPSDNFCPPGACNAGHLHSACPHTQHASPLEPPSFRQRLGQAVTLDQAKRQSQHQHLASSALQMNGIHWKAYQGLRKWISPPAPTFRIGHWQSDTASISKHQQSNIFLF